MKANRRLGKGLDALLDLQPAGDDGSARVSEAVEGSSDRSVLSTSVPRAERTIQRRASRRAASAVDAPSAGVRAPTTAAAPPAAASPPAPPPPPMQFQLFDPPLLAAPPAVPEQPAPPAATLDLRCEAPAPPPPAARAPTAAPPHVPPQGDDESAFLDDAVVGLAFPEVDLDS